MTTDDITRLMSYFPGQPCQASIRMSQRWIFWS